MSPAPRRDILRELLLAVWGLGTMVLLFIVVLLVAQMMKEGRDPMDGLRPKAAPTAERTGARTSVALGQRTVQLYFADPAGVQLIPEARSLNASDSVEENCREALAALIAGPQSGGSPVLPSAAKVRALFLLENGELVVDFSRDLISAGARTQSATSEALMVYAIATTLTQEALQVKGGTRVSQVRFLFEGAAPQEGFPAHLNLSGPVRPDQKWLEAPGAAAGNG